MQIAIIGTGREAANLTKGAIRAGHVVAIGSRRPEEITGFASPVTDIGSAIASAELVINAIPGSVALEVLSPYRDQLAGKVLLDTSNAMNEAGDLFYPNSSVAQHLQTALPETPIVKSLTPLAGYIAIDPGAIPGPSTVFLAGDDDAGKAVVASFLASLGWSPETQIDLGGIDGAKALEHSVFLYFSLVNLWGTGEFNISIIRGSIEGR